MKTPKRLLAFILSFALLFSMMPTFTITSSALTYSYYSYEVSNNGAKITGCDTSISGDVTIPSTIDGYAVTKIGSSAFRGCSGLTSITVPNSVTSIGDSAFSGCSGLTSISLPFVGDKPHISSDTYQYPFGYIFGTLSYTGGKVTMQRYYSRNSSLTDITTYGFDYYCIPTSLKTVTITGNSYIPHSAFLGCTGLTRIRISNGVTSIGYFAFSSCSGLTDITIPNSVTSIGDSAFKGCNSLTSISLPFVGDKPHTSTDKNQYPFGYIFGKSSFTGATRTWQYYYGSSLSSTTSTSYYIPNSLKSVTITGSSYIPYGAFYSCSGLTDITISNSVTSIGDSAFKGCNSLTSISLPFVGESATTNIGYKSVFGYIFGYTTNYSSSETSKSSSTTFVNQDVSTTTPSDTRWQYSCYDYYYKSNYFLQSYYYYIPTSLKFVMITGSSCISNAAFNNCSGLTGITIDSSITSIGDYAFSKCWNITNITIPNSVKSIGDSAFRNCTGLTSIIIPDNVTSIGSNAFYDCSKLTNVIIPDSVTSIGSNAFYDCSKLTNVIIPDSVTSIGSDAFYNTEWYNNQPDGLVYAGKVAYKYKGACPTNITIIEGTLGIAGSAFSECSNLKSVTIPNSITNIGSKAFYNCSGLSMTSIVIPSSVTGIGDYAFYNCSGLTMTSIVIPNSVTSIGDYAFNGISKLLYCKFMGNAPTLGKNTFNSGVVLAHYKSKTGWTHPTYEGYTCRYLDLSSESDVCQLDSDNKNSQGLLFTLNEDGSATVGDDTSTNNNSLLSDYTNVLIPEYVIKDGKQYPVTAIGHNAFSGFKYLETISISKSVRTIEKDAFVNSPFLYSISVDSQNTSYSTDEYGVLYNRNKTQLVKYPGGSESKTYVVPETVVSILEGAFNGTQNLEELTVPFVGGYSSSSASKSSLFGYIFGTAHYTGGNLVTQYYDSSNYATYFIPSSLKKVTVKGGQVQYGAFDKCSSITELILAENVTFIGYKALRGCSALTKLTLPFIGESDKSSSSSFQYLLGYIFGSDNFSNSYAVSQQYLASSSTSFSTSTYYIPTSLKELTVLSSRINYGALSNCTRIERVNAPNLTQIAARAFYNCSSLSELNTTAGIDNIPDYAFYGCSKLSSLKVKDTSTAIGEYAFYNCSSLIDFSIPSMCTSIGKYAFYGCSNLESIRIPLQITAINEYTFYGCTSAKEITIPSKLSSIGKYAFYSCTKLEKINYKAKRCSNISSGNTPFYNAGSRAEKLEIYIGADVTSIPSYLFYNATGATSIVFDPACQCTSIGDSAFYGLSKLNSVIIPYTVTSIGECAFYGCLSLKGLELPIRLTTIGKTAFKNCSSINEIAIPSGVTSVGLGAFEGCSSLEELATPRVYNTNIGYIFGASSYSNNATYVPKSLKRVIVTGEISRIESNAFYGCSSIETISYPDTVTYIGSNAFYNCSSLLEASISDDVTYLGSNAFYGCNGLTKLYIGKNISSLNAFTFPTYSRLKTITVSDDNYYYSNDKSGVLFNKNKTELICYPQSRTYPYYNVPDTVTKIPSNAFISNNTYLKQIVIPKSVKSIAAGNLLKCSKLLVYSDSAALNYAIENNISFEIIDSMTLLGIRVQNLPDNTEVVKNCKMDTTGLYVIGNYDIGDIQIDDYTLSYDNATIGKQMVTVSYGGFSDIFEIEVVEPYPVSLSIVQVNKTEYIEGETFDKEGLIVSLIWADGSSTNLPSDKLLCLLDSSTPGYKFMPIIFNLNGIDYMTLQPCIVKPKSVTGIQVDSDNTKTVYEYGQALKLTDAAVELCYDNGLGERIDEYIIKGYNAFVLGEQVLTVEYNNYQATYTIVLEKRTVAAPKTAPEIIEVTDSSVTVKGQDNYQYSVDGKTWQDSNTIKDLDYHTDYVVYQRIKETDTTKSSPASEGTEFTTCYSLNGYVAVKGKLVSGQTLTAYTDAVTPFGAECDYVWKRNGQIISGASSNTYIVTNRDVNASITVEVIGKNGYYGTLTGNAPPRIPVILTVSSYSVVLTALSGCQYSHDGISWQDSASFDDLKPNTEYTFYQRMAPTLTSAASEASEALTIVTDKADISGEISIIGLPVIGNTLTVNLEELLPDNCSVAYQWYCDGAAIDGAAEESYTIISGDLNHEISVTVTGIGDYEGSVSSGGVLVTIPVTGITLDKTTATIKTGENLTLKATIIPEDAVNKNIVWLTEEKGIVTVENGIVTALKKGTETITVRTEDGDYLAMCIITVECSHSNTVIIPAEKSSCQTHGHDEYTLCNDCGEILSGSDAEFPFADHDLIHHEYKEATTDAEGNIEYWICNVCGKYFGDSEGKTEIDSESVILPIINKPEILLGDVDGDNVVTILDATYIQRKLAGLPNQNGFIEEASDTDGDGDLSILDATFIQRWLAGLTANESIGKLIV